MTIRRKADSDSSEPGNTATPRPGPAIVEEWEIIGISDPIARWTAWTYRDSGSHQLVNFYDGADPTTCGTASVTLGFPNDCLKDGSGMFAFYDSHSSTPSDQKYIAVSTESAMLGAPTQSRIGKGQMTQAPDGGGSDCANGVVCFTQEMQDVWLFECSQSGPPPPGEGPVETPLCVNGADFFGCLQDALCEAICMCPAFAQSEECVTPCADNGCDWQWDGGDWININSNCLDPCICGPKPEIPPPPGTQVDDIVSVPCVNPPPPPCGTCNYTWNIANGEWDLDQPTYCTGSCECVDRFSIAYPEDQSQPANITLDCITVTPPPGECCDECGGDRVDITNLFGNGDPYFNYQQTAASEPLGDGCSWKVPIEVWENNEDSLDEEAHYYKNATVSYSGGVWSVSVGQTSHPYAAPPNDIPSQNMDWTSNTPCVSEQKSCEDGICNDNGVATMGVSRVTCPVVLSAALRTAHPELFKASKGCGCKDAANVMDRWGKERSIEKIDTLVRMIASRCEDYTTDEIKQKLLDVLNGSK